MRPRFADLGRQAGRPSVISSRSGGGSTGLQKLSSPTCAWLGSCVGFAAAQSSRVQKTSNSATPRVSITLASPRNSVASPGSIWANAARAATAGGEQQKPQYEMTCDVALTTADGQVGKQTNRQADGQAGRKAAPPASCLPACPPGAGRQAAPGAGRQAARDRLTTLVIARNHAFDPAGACAH